MIRCSSDPSFPRELACPEFVFLVKSHVLSFQTLLLLGQKRSGRSKPVPFLTAVFLIIYCPPQYETTNLQVAYKQ